MPRYFKWSEFDQPGLDGSGARNMNKAFVEKLDAIREECGFPLNISSGYRSPDYNDTISSTGRLGPHTTGRAVDIPIYGERAHTLLKVALKHGMTGIGVKQKRPYNKSFIHLDDLTKSDGYPRPWVWSY